jgi:hypothetical protein
VPPRTKSWSVVAPAPTCGYGASSGSHGTNGGGWRHEGSPRGRELLDDVQQGHGPTARRGQHVSSALVAGKCAIYDRCVVCLM